MVTLTRPSAAPVESVTRPRMPPACAASRLVAAMRASTAQHVSNEMRFPTVPPREERQDGEGAPNTRYGVAESATPQAGRRGLRAVTEHARSRIKNRRARRALGGSTRREVDQNSVVEAERGPHRSRLVSQVPHAGAAAPLPVQCEERPLVGQVVEEHRNLPARTRQADADVNAVVRRQPQV